MRLLIDTHLALWEIVDDPRLSSRARSLISAPDNEVFISVVSLWEIAIKHARARLPVSAERTLAYFVEAGHRFLDVRPAHALALESLPHLHRDPFDRMLLAQAQSEPLRLLSSDSALAAYSDFVELV